MIELNDIFIPTVLQNTDQDCNFGNRNFNTRDMFFLPSVNEYNKDFSDLIIPTDLAVFQGALNFNGLYGLSSIIKQIKDNNYSRAYLRSSQKHFDSNKISIVGSDGDVYCVDPWEGNLPHSIQLWTQVNINLLNKIAELNPELNPDFIHFRKQVLNPFKSINYIDIGEFPTSVVNNLESQKLEKEYQKGIGNSSKLVPTGKTFTLGIDKKTQQLQRFMEFYVIADDTNKSIKQKVIRYKKDNIIQWVDVKKISWEMIDTLQLPLDLQKQAEANESIFIRTEYAINAGLPFFMNKNIYNNYFWQNSTPRAWANSINVSNLKENGNPDYAAVYMGGNFDGIGFAVEAFSELVERLKTIEIEKPQRKPVRIRDSWGVEIREKPMTIDEQLKFYVENGKAVMLHGLSGVGKSRRVQALDPDMIKIDLFNGMDAEEVKGKTIYRNNDKTQSGEWLPPYWYHLLCEKCAKEPDKKHIVFIDELTNVKPSVQSLVYHIVLEHTIGLEQGKLPDNAVVVAAGNSIAESAAAFEMAEPLFRRFVAHVEIPLDVQNWLEWASEFDTEKKHIRVHPLITSFVGTYGEKVFYSHYDPENPPKTAIDPRGWEQVSDVIYDNKGVLARELIENKVGKEITASLFEFARKVPITLEDILTDNYNSNEVPTKFDAKYALALSLRFAKMEEVETVRNFIARYLGAEILKMYDSMWVGEDNEKAIFLSKLSQPKITQQNQGWIK